jgi:iron-sulfur cluster assembly protein
VLTITADAAQAIRAAREMLALPESAGLRISTVPHSLNGRGPAFTAEMAAEPAAGDQILEDEGAHVFVEPEASPELDDKQLDAEIESGEVRFAVRDQA